MCANVLGCVLYTQAGSQDDLKTYAKSRKYHDGQGGVFPYKNGQLLDGFQFNMEIGRVGGFASDFSFKLNNLYLKLKCLLIFNLGRSKRTSHNLKHPPIYP